MARAWVLFIFINLIALNSFAVQEIEDELASNQTVTNSQTVTNVHIFRANAALLALEPVAIQYAPHIIRFFNGLRVGTWFTGPGIVVTVGSVAFTVKFDQVIHDRPSVLHIISPELDRIDQRIWQGVIYGTVMAYHTVASNLLRTSPIGSTVFHRGFTREAPVINPQPVLPPKVIPVPANANRGPFDPSRNGPKGPINRKTS